MMFPKGTIIRIGQNEASSIVQDAIGMEFELKVPLNWGDYAKLCKVTKRPEGSYWGSQVSHKLNPYGDKAVYIPGRSKNKDAAMMLDKEW